MRRFLDDLNGNIATIFAIVAVPLILVIVGVIQMSAMSNLRNVLQAAADAGALSGATNMTMASGSIGDASVIEIARSSAMMQIKNHPELLDPHFEVVIDAANGTVTVTGAASYSSLLIDLGVKDKNIQVTSVAEAMRKMPLRVLQTTNAAPMTMTDAAKITAPGCAIHSNHNITLTSNASIQAGIVQSVGTITGNVSPQGTTGALKIDDPFSDLDLTPPTVCPEKSALKSLLSTTVYVSKVAKVFTLPAGVHCDPIIVTGNAVLNLAPGEHYFEDVFHMTNNTRLQGKDVVLIINNRIFAKKYEMVRFIDDTTVTLSARESGKFAGFLLITTRTNDVKLSITSSKVSQLLGTIYMPNSELAISTTGSVAQDSAWSVIIAQKITLSQNPNLVINKDYVGSSVPVPKGVGPNGHVKIKS